ncbi:GNAT family N-acetyltransferase [Streptomyces sp. NPDC055078]
MEYRTATPADEPSLHALWHTAFGTAPVAELWARDQGRHRRTFVAADGGRVLSAVHYQPRPIRSAAATVERVGCLGSVATLPEARGRGHVSALLTQAVRTMTDDGCAWSLLFTGTPRVYEGAGWRTFTASGWTGPLAPEAGSPAPDPRVRPARPSDLPALRDGYDAHRPLTTVRTPEDWQHRVPVWYDPAVTETLVAQAPDGRPTGFLVLRHRDDTALIAEIALSADAPSVARALLSAAAGRARAAGHSTADVRLPPDDAVVTALPALLADARPVEHRTGMYRTLHADPAAVRATVTAPGAVHWHGDSF